ncbi:MAG TPA: DUF3168 domain-containing protein [Candidatus Cloacimonas sp.]|nr:DUF3168 domain-containing protein [Candidatus Cloacimonas sp.]
MEKALKYELENQISELSGAIYPTNAPKTATKPYLVYMRINTDKAKTLKGFEGSQALSFMFNIMTQKYSSMKSLTKKVEDFLMSLPGTTIGEENISIQDIDINDITEQYEHELQVNRGIIDFTIYF